jgi:hypothetical protein
VGADALKALVASEIEKWTPIIICQRGLALDHFFRRVPVRPFLLLVDGRRARVDYDGASLRA